MEEVAPNIAYRRLKYVSDWRLVKENQHATLAAIVLGISRLNANDFALESYSFVADNYAPFYSRPIECTDRDPPFVLDGVLYHESVLNLEEHYTDTHGYTEINLAAFTGEG